MVLTRFRLRWKMHGSLVQGQQGAQWKLSKHEIRKKTEIQLKESPSTQHELQLFESCHDSKSLRNAKTWQPPDVSLLSPRVVLDVRKPGRTGLLDRTNHVGLMWSSTSKSPFEWCSSWQVTTKGDPSLGTNVESVPLISVFQAQAALDLLGQHEMVQLESIQKSWVFLVVNYSLESPLKWISLPKMFWPPATTTLNKMWRRLESCFSPTNFTLYLEPKTEVHMRCSKVHGVGYVAEYLGCKGGGTACVIHNVLVTLRDVHFLFVRQPCFEE